MAIQTRAGTASEPSKGLRIVIIGINYAPELTGIAPYTTAVADHYASRGHTVRVLTGAPHYPEWRRRRPPAVAAEYNPRVTRYWHVVPRRTNAWSRLMYEATWFMSASRGVMGARCDVVIGIVPNLSDGLLALLAGRRWGARVGLVIQDLVGPAAAQSGYPGGGTVAGLTAGIERYIAQHADVIAVISSGFQRYLEKWKIPKHRFHRVCNWTHDGMATESISESRKRLGWADEEFVCLHAGNMGQKQGLDTVIEAAGLLRGAVRVVLSGDGNDRTRLEALVRLKGITNVSFQDLQPPGQYEAMLRAANVLLLNQRGSVGDMSLPSKLASYFASGRPVVAAVAPDSEAACRVEEAGGGLTIRPDDPVALAGTVRTLRNSPALANDLGLRGKAYAEQHLTPEAALAGYDVFLECLRTGRTSALDTPRKTVSGVRG